MDPMYFGIGFLVIFCIVLLLCQSVDTQNFQDKFARMGDLRGKTLDQIIAEMGKPQSALRMPDGNIIVQWISGKYSIALAFNAERSCLGVYSELMAAQQYAGGVGVGVSFDL